MITEQELGRWREKGRTEGEILSCVLWMGGGAELGEGSSLALINSSGLHDSRGHNKTIN